MTGIVRRQFPSLRGTTWRNNGSSTRNDSHFEHDIRILNEEYKHSRGEIENVMPALVPYSKNMVIRYHDILDVLFKFTVYR